MSSATGCSQHGVHRSLQDRRQQEKAKKEAPKGPPPTPGSDGPPPVQSFEDYLRTRQAKASTTQREEPEAKGGRGTPRQSATADGGRVVTPRQSHNTDSGRLTPRQSDSGRLTPRQSSESGRQSLINRSQNPSARKLEMEGPPPTPGTSSGVSTPRGHSSRNSTRQKEPETGPPETPEVKQRRALALRLRATEEMRQRTVKEGCAERERMKASLSQTILTRRLHKADFCGSRCRNPSPNPNPNSTPRQRSSRRFRGTRKRWRRQTTGSTATLPITPTPYC